MITSATNWRWDGHVDVPANDRTGLPAASLVRAAKTATVDADRIVRICGRLPAAARHEVSKSLQDHLAALKPEQRYKAV